MSEKVSNNNISKRVAIAAVALGPLLLAGQCGKGEQAPTYTHMTVAELEAKAKTKNCPAGTYVDMTDVNITRKDVEGDTTHHYFKVAGAAHFAIRSTISDPKHDQPVPNGGPYHVNGLITSVGNHYACVVDEIALAHQ